MSRTEMALRMEFEKLNRKIELYELEIITLLKKDPITVLINDLNQKLNKYNLKIQRLTYVLLDKTLPNMGLKYDYYKGKYYSKDTVERCISIEREIERIKFALTCFDDKQGE